MRSLLFFKNRPILIVGFVLLVFAAPLLQTGAGMWAKEHYQFFPLVLFGAAALAWLRISESPSHTRLLRSPDLVSIRSVFWFGLGILLAFGSFWGSSPWLGVVGAWCLAKWILVVLVNDGHRELLNAPLNLLLLIIPLPLALDQSLIIEMQKLAADGAGDLLDRYNVPHIVQGVSMRTADEEFFVEDACSGIHSLFSSLTVMMFWAAFWRYGRLRILLTLAHTVVWVLVANIVRVFLVIYVEKRHGISIDAGWRHAAVGILTYGLAITLALSMDQFLRFVVRVRPGGDPKNELPHEWDITGFLDQPRFSSNTALRFWGAAMSGLLLLGILLISNPMLAFASHLMSPGKSFANPVAEAAGVVAPDQVQVYVDQLNVSHFDGLFPNRIGDFALLETNGVERGIDDEFGSHSIVATYQGGGHSVQVSVDGYYNEWHDLTICYGGLGWNVMQATNRLQPAVPGDTQLKLFRGDGERAYCVYSCFDLAGRFVPPKFVGDTPIRSLVRRLFGSDEMVVEDRSTVVPPLLQLQLFCGSETTFLQEETDSFDKLFDHIEKEFLERLSKRSIAQQSQEQSKFDDTIQAEKG